MPQDEAPKTSDGRPAATRDERPETGDVQCPNCCKRAPITARRMGLLFYRCELCGSVGATPEPVEAP